MLLIFLDIDECFEKKAGCYQICINTVGSFSCSCNQGFKLAWDKKHCIGNWFSQIKRTYLRSSKISNGNNFFSQNLSVCINVSTHSLPPILYHFALLFFINFYFLHTFKRYGFFVKLDKNKFTCWWLFESNVCTKTIKFLCHAVVWDWNHRLFLCI